MEERPAGEENGADFARAYEEGKQTLMRLGRYDGKQ